MPATADRIACPDGAGHSEVLFGAPGGRAVLTPDAPTRELDHWSAAPPADLVTEAARLRDLGHGPVVSYSRKVFIPLTRLCRDTCRYCTFVRGPRGAASAYLPPDEVLAIARAGKAAG